MAKEKLIERIKKKEFKDTLVNIVLSMLVGLGIYKLFEYVNAPAETWYFLFTILLLLIYLEQPNKK